MITIRRGVTADAPALAALAEQTFHETFALDNSVEDMAAYAAESFSPALQRQELSDPDVTTLLSIDAAGALIAFAQVRRGEAPPCVTGSQPVELWRFYVERAYHGRGVAQQLMDAVLVCARARTARTIWLGVWERNWRAQAFYRKTGFTDVGAHTFVLGRDVQTDRVMVQSLEADV